MVSRHIYLLINFLYHLVVLTELPLPSPLPSAVNNKGLLYTPQIAEEAQRLLGRQDENLIPQLVHVLSQTNTDNM